MYIFRLTFIYTWPENFFMTGFILDRCDMYI